MDAAETTDPRVSRTQARVRDAIRELFEEQGAASLTHQRVAQRSGVGRATIYRHWPQTVDLLFEALTTIEEPILRPGRGPLRSWLRREMRKLSGDLGAPVGLQALVAILNSAHDQRIADLRDDLVRKTVQTLASMLRRHADTAAVDPELMMVRLVGPLIVQVSLMRGSADDEFIDQIIDSALSPYQDRSYTSRR
ncbi:TetR/AcrR family transcriptional regulator [Gordonia rubripertincta]|uniref:TetR/AcrR family transcriptional regulator n=1 Tax=Gordonia rubripertincta TaxID=36822 RepID=UPI000B8D8A90|nr:TetR/AcrR family transcriptional regulator [Gordonia rubripertincta]ASR03107.1 Transcriptional regulator, TetR family [Gordonia rubripertincta]